MREGRKDAAEEEMVEAFPEKLMEAVEVLCETETEVEVTPAGGWMREEEP